MEHNNFVFICPFIYNVSQGKQLFSVRKYSTTPGRVTLMTNYNLLLKSLDCFVQDCWILILIWTGELVLVLNEWHDYRQLCQKTVGTADQPDPEFIEDSDIALIDINCNSKHKNDSSNSPERRLKEERQSN